MSIAESAGTPTPWRGELKARQTEIAEFILAHAEPEVAMRLAQDTAHDLRNTVQDALRRRHGRTFDPAYDWMPPTATYRYKPDPATERVVAAVAAHPGITVAELGTLPGLSSEATRCIVLPMLVRQGRLRREGTGNANSAYRYYPAGEPQ